MANSEVKVKVNVWNKLKKKFQNGIFYQSTNTIKTVDGVLKLDQVEKLTVSNMATFPEKEERKQSE